MIPRLSPWLSRGMRSVLCGVMVLLVAAGFETSRAQVVLDGKFGTSGALAGPNYNVTAGLGARQGNNLFHSFAQFDLKAGDVASFSGPANIQNILSRVTGGSPSSIDGTIRSDIAGANFFLINPKGVMFGPNASLDVSGSFAASTADYLKLADGARFVAALDADDSKLSSAPVSAFGFLGNNSGRIALEQSKLKVSDTKTLSLVGGDIAATGGSVQSAAGQINLASVQSAGEVPVDPAALSVVEFNAAFPQQGQINLQNKTQVDASGGGGGRVVIRGGQLTMDNSKIQSNTTGTTDGQGIEVSVVNDIAIVKGGQINSLSTTGRGAGGNVTLNAQSIMIDGAGLTDNNFNPTTQISTLTSGGAAKGGDIVIKSGHLELVNSAQISSASLGAGNAGRIDITASSVSLDARGTKLAQITANTQRISGGAGNAGDIEIHTASLDMFNGATIVAASFGSGKAGLIDINAQSLNLKGGSVIAASAFGAGTGGNIQITADSVNLNGQDTMTGEDFLTGVQAVTTASAPGGNIHVTTGSLEMEHMGSIFTTSYPTARGPAGTIDIDAQSINLRSGAIITAETQGAGNGGNVQIASQTLRIDGHDTSITAVTKNTASPAPGGNIQITAGTMDLDHLGSVSTTSFGPGPGGNIEVSSRDLTLANGATIRAAGEATGPAGKISVSADGDILLAGNSAISTSALKSSGGDIHAKAGNEIQLTDSEFNARAGPGGGGNITVSAPSLVYLLDGTFTAQAVGDGGNLTVIDPVFFILNNGALISKSSTKNGGNITILSDFFFQSDSIIDASAPFGLPGTVTVSAPEVDLSGSLIGLPSNLLDAAAQLRPDCGVRLTGNISSFIVLGRGGLPIEPGGFVPSGTVPPVDEKR